MMIVSVKDEHELKLGSATYWLRTASPYDMPKMRRLLTRQGVRRPTPTDLRVAAIAGVEQMADATGEIVEGERQRGLIEEWYEMMPAVDENDVDEPDGEKRAAIVEERDRERRRRMNEIYPDIAAIEANLERHHPVYRELIADGRYWDDVSRIDAVRLLLMRTDAGALPRDRDDLVDTGVFMAIPEADRLRLATFAFELLSLTDTRRKN